jgi:hypothetical protein
MPLPDLDFYPPVYRKADATSGTLTLLTSEVLITDKTVREADKPVVSAWSVTIFYKLTFRHRSCTLIVLIFRVSNGLHIVSCCFPPGIRRGIAQVMIFYVARHPKERLEVNSWDCY